MLIRKAEKRDCRALAYLTNLAAEGLAGHMWGLAAPEGMTALEYGEHKVSQETGNFSYRNAWVMTEESGQVAGMLLSMLQPDPYELPDFSKLPIYVRPLIELEALAPGSYYVNVLGVFEQYQGRGFGSALMKKAEDLASESSARQLSLIVASDNHNAKNLYLKLGYEMNHRKPVVPYEGMLHGGDWILMTKSI